MDACLFLLHNKILESLFLMSRCWLIKKELLESGVIYHLNFSLDLIGLTYLKSKCERFCFSKSDCIPRKGLGRDKHLFKSQNNVTGITLKTQKLVGDCLTSTQSNATSHTILNDHIILVLSQSSVGISLSLNTPSPSGPSSDLVLT